MSLVLLCLRPHLAILFDMDMFVGGEHADFVIGKLDPVFVETLVSLVSFPLRIEDLLREPFDECELMLDLSSFRLGLVLGLL